MSMLKLGNVKLGQGIWTFSLPAGSTCPGKTKLCSSLCYAKKGFYVFGTVKKFLAENKRNSNRSDFVTIINYELREIRPRTVRWHASGDFYSAAYAEKVLQIIKSNPGVVFYMYTRSWRDPAIAVVLKKMCKLQNCIMWLSTDSDSPKAPNWTGSAGTAYLAQSVFEKPVGADLVFVDSPSTATPTKFLNGTLVCPYEQGIVRKKPVTCSTCGFCLERQKGRQFTAASSSVGTPSKRMPLKLVG